MATTPTYALPYPLGSDFVINGDDAIKALAERVEALLAQRHAVPSSSRNVIRNGDLGVAQRGNGPFTSGMTIDGFKWYAGGTSNGNITRAEFGALNATLRYDLIATMTTPASAAGDYLFIGIPIEDVRTFAGRVCTLSMRAASSVAGRTIGVSVRQNFGTGGAPSAIVDTAIGNFQPVVSSAGLDSAGAYTTLTFTMPSIAAKTIGTASDHQVELRLWLASGSTQLPTSGFSSAAQGTQAAFTFILTQIQLEAGSLATPFERLNQQAQLVWNQRYFIRKTYPIVNAGVCVGTAWAQNAYYGVMHYPTMRTAPTTYTPSAATHFSAWSNQVSGVANQFVLQSGGPDSCEWYMATASGPGTGNGIWVRAAVAGAYIDLSAEL